MTEELDYEGDDFADIVAKDSRYHPRAYTLLMHVIGRLSGPEHDRHMDGFAIMDEFKETVLDQFGPLSLRVVNEWGLKSCEDLGEMMFNLADAHRIQRDEDDSKDCFLSGFDFEEEFLGPFRA